MPSREVLGRDPRFLEAVRVVQRAAERGLPLLLEGETGTGKDLLARFAHSCGPFRGGPFVAVNCGSLSRELARSELFGHEKGAFTGAVARRAGAFELSCGGTLLLNEIGELPADVQVDLLQVLDEKRWSRLGGSESFAWRAGLVCATNADLDELVSRRAFRRDLFHRIKDQRVLLPPLRERRGDAGLLAGEFLRRAGRSGLSFGPGVPEAFDAYTWPGNVRELEREVTRAALLAEGGEIRVRDLSPELLDAGAGGTGPRAHMRGLLDGEKRRRALKALADAGGVIAAAARLMGMKPWPFRRMCRRLGVPLEAPCPARNAGCGTRKSDGAASAGERREDSGSGTQEIRKGWIEDRCP